MSKDACAVPLSVHVSDDSHGGGDDDWPIADAEEDIVSIRVVKMFGAFLVWAIALPIGSDFSSGEEGEIGLLMMQRRMAEKRGELLISTGGLSAESDWPTNDKTRFEIQTTPIRDHSRGPCAH